MKIGRFISVLGLVILASCQSSQPLGELVNTTPGMSQDLESFLKPGDVYFSSRDPGCKSVVGAVPSGTSIEFRFFTKNTMVDSVDLVVMSKLIEGNGDSVSYSDETVIPMVSAPAPGREGWTLWTSGYGFQTPGTWSYHFALKKGDKQLYYGNNFDNVDVPYVDVRGLGGVGTLTGDEEVFPYNQTVYSPAVTMDPKWAESVIYYIFPERFKNGNPENDPVPGKTLFYDHKTVEKHTPWSDPKPWVPGNGDGHKGDDAEYNNDFYGGDLDGIIQKLDYLQDLGVTLIYMTPIFQAPSSHKYDTGDFKTIDPGFGTLDTFKNLVAEGKKRGIGIIMDASLNHSGSDSVYMDRYGKYPGLGAFENGQIQKDSPFADWYTFTGNPDPDKAYKQWANPTLATLKETDSWKKFAFLDPDSISKYWLRQGAAGWRMDVTPWKSDKFWMEWRSAVKKDFPDAITYSEVWFDASKYLTGDMFDSTMNYIFRGTAILLGKGGDARKVRGALEMLQENYPKEAFYRTMNLTSSHDVPRTLFELGYKTVDQKDFDKFRPGFLQIAALQFTFPGNPTIYYGDEIGITGGADPYCRGPFPWKEDGGTYGDWSLLDDYKKLSKIRRDHKDIFAHGDLKFLPGNEHLLVFERTGKSGTAVVVFNNGTAAQSGLLGVSTPGTYMDLWSGESLDLTQGITIPSGNFKILLKK